MKDNSILTCQFVEAKHIIVSGDIHGDFNLLVNKLCVQYGMNDTLLIVAGDCGFGFEKPGYYDNIVRRNSKRMNEANNWILFVRGNHDNPAYFDGVTFNHQRFRTIPDYSVVSACGRDVLCVGGAISMDRQYRKDWLAKRRKPIDEDDKFASNVYWPNEAPVFDEGKLQVIDEEYKIDTVVTHTAPSFCELRQKTSLLSWAESDKDLLFDVSYERKQMDEIYHWLTRHNHPLRDWCYGHFHQSWHKEIDGTLFNMLDIMEFRQLC